MKKIVAVAAIIILAGLAYLYMRPLPKVATVASVPIVPKAKPVDLSWPAAGQSAIGALGYGVLDTHGDQKPVPIASITKIITAYAVLSQRPLGIGEQGPTIKLDNTDLGYFNYYYTHGGSDTNVKAGEKITEYQALQSMLLPSSNNMADSLARWAFGSVNDYVAYANQMVRNLGLTNTTVGSSSGFSDKTFSTAEDLVKLGETVLKSPVIAEIVGQQTAKIPVEGAISNVNNLVGSYGINGIKTGNTDKAGGCYLFSSKQVVNGQPIELIGAVLDQGDLTHALTAAPPLIKDADAGFQRVTAIKKGQKMGYYRAPWGAMADIVTQNDVSLLVWRGQPLEISNLPKTASAPLSIGSTVGTVTVLSGTKAASSPLLLGQDLSEPSWRWRIFHK